MAYNSTLLKLNPLKTLLTILLLILTLSLSAQEADIYLKDGAIVKFSQGATIVYRGSINVSSGATFTQNANLDLTGNINNLGTFTSSLGYTKFVGGLDSWISGNGATTHFYAIILDKSNDMMLLVNADTFSFSNNFLTLLQGTFLLESQLVSSNIVFAIDGGISIIPDGAAFILNNANTEIILTGDKLLHLRGSLILQNGKINIGSSGQAGLIYDNTTNAGILTIESGELNIWGRLSPNIPATDLLDFSISNGILRVGYGINSNAANVGILHFNDNSSFSMTGGIIEVNRHSTDNATSDIVLSSNTNSMTAGTIQIKGGEAGQSIELSADSDFPILNLTLLGDNNAQLVLKSDVTVNNLITLNGSGAERFKIDNNFSLFLKGNFVGNLADITGFNSGTVVFDGTGNQAIQGTTTTAFKNVTINKTSGIIELEQDAKITGDLKLVSTTAQIDIKNKNLYLGANAIVYADDGTLNTLADFSANKSIVNSYPTSPLSGGKVFREIASSPTYPVSLLYPISAGTNYMPARIDLPNSGSTIGSNAAIGVKPVKLEHPEVELTSVSLSKYWNVQKQDITLGGGGVNLYLYYNTADVNGNEYEYKVLRYAPAYNDAAGKWSIDPGSIYNVVDFNNDNFSSEGLTEPNGDWTAGETKVVGEVYYARADGDYNNPTTWSKLGFNGAPSATAPNKDSDIIRIQDHTITISAPISESQYFTLENGTAGRTAGKLIIEGNNYVPGNSVIIEQNTTLEVQHQDGISNIASTGAIQSISKSLSTTANYKFSGNQTQVTGNAIPASVRSIIVEKDDGVEVTLSKNISIADSLVINSGTLFTAGFGINGGSANRTLRMRGGELKLGGNFPSNYSTPYFTIGTINYASESTQTISSSASFPAVNQYFNLKISASAKAGNVNFADNGEIRISNNFDISGLNFASNSYKFNTNNSTVLFNKNGGTQSINVVPASPADTVCNLEFFNLIIDSTGTKQINPSTGTPLFKVLNDLTIRNSATFDANNNNIEIQNNWNNPSGVFIPGTATVVFRSNESTLSTNINFANLTDNPFNNLVIYGPGTVQLENNLQINGNLTIKNTGILNETAVTTPALNLTINGNIIIENGGVLNGSNRVINLTGNWTNNGSFNYATSTINFVGTSEQLISKTTGNESLFNMTINNGNHVNASTIGGASNGLNVYGNLNLQNGNLRTHVGTNYRFVSAIGTLTRENGFVDGELRKLIASGASSKEFEVGYLNSYTPITLEFTGTGGVSGYLGVMSDTITTTTSPVSWNTAPPTDILPTGHGLNPNSSSHIRRRFEAKIPSGSSFSLGSRQYNATYIYQNLDIGTQDKAKLTFAILKTDNTSWLKQKHYGAKPVVGDRIPSQNLIRIDSIGDFGNFVLGLPRVLTYYSRQTGNWYEAQSWSYEGHDGNAADERPGTNDIMFVAYIGGNDTITLDGNIRVDRIGLDTALVQVDSSGTIKFEKHPNTQLFYYLFGNGEFRLNKYSKLITDNQKGINLLGDSGSVRTGVRNFNYGNHNKSTFVYNGAGQNSGTGLCTGTDTVYKLFIEQSSGTFTLNSNVDLIVSDSIHLKSGTLNSGAKHITLLGHLRMNSGTVYTHNNKNFTFAGTNSLQTVNAPAANLSFYRLWIDKNKDSSVVKFLPTASGNSYNISVDSLIFQTDNKAYIDLSSSFTAEGFPDYNKGEWFMTMNNNSTAGINRLGQGHIDGELRKFVNVSTVIVRYEVGNSYGYRPFVLTLNNSVSNDTAGIIGVQQISYYHPEISYLTNYNLQQSKMFSQYWRLSRPSTSNAAKSTRTMSIALNYVYPNDIPFGTTTTCYDFSFWRGPNNSNWQRLWPSNTNSCASRSPNSSEGSYSGITNTSTTVSVSTTSINFAYRSLGLSANNRFLLGDFIIGQQGPAELGLQYFSKQDGNWTNPNTWVTGSYSNSVNEGFYPKTMHDLAFIGEGKKVTLDANIGSSYTNGEQVTDQFYEQSLGGLRLEKTANGSGHLDAGTYVVRTSTFEMEDGCTFETGAEDGVHSSVDRGNIIRMNGSSTISANYNYGNHNNGNYIFNAEGKIPATYNQSNDQYCLGSGLSTTYGHISRVRFSIGSSFGSAFFDNSSDRSTDGFRYYPDKVVSVTSGQQYTMRINILGFNQADSYYATLYIDTDYNGTFDSGERISGTTRFPSSAQLDMTFTIPLGLSTGTTQARLIVRNDSDIPTNRCDPDNDGADYGEVEDYTVFISNPTYVSNQSTGTGLPASIGLMTINADASETVTLSSAVTIANDLTVNSGSFVPFNNAITIGKDLVNNSGANKIDTATMTTVTFNGTSASNVTGTHPTDFKSLILNKTGNNLNLNHSTYINTLLQFNTDSKLIVDNDAILTLGPNSSVSPNTGNFSQNRMIEIAGNTEFSYVKKELTAGSSSYTLSCIPSLVNGQYILGVEITDSFINNNGTRNTTSQGYSDYTNLTTSTFSVGTIYQFRGAKSSNFTTHYWRVWFDLDQSGSFESNELLVSGSTSSTNFSQNFTLPDFAYNGSMFMRVKLSNSTTNVNEPCQTSGTISGEFEDYLINVTNGVIKPINNYCVPSLGNGSQYITRVRYGTLDFSNTDDTGFTFQTSATIPDITANVSTQFIGSKSSSSGTRYWRIWIDLNHNGIFENSESMANNNTSSTNYTTNITIPTSAFNGKTRMRVKLRNSADVDNPCETSSTTGEYEDYLINITGGATRPPINGYPYSFLFPIGTNGVYNPADLDLSAETTGTPSISVWLKDAKHPNRRADDVLNKYWKIQTSGLGNVVGNDIRFGFQSSDVSGNTDDYIPAHYDGQWEINLGANPDVTANEIVLTPNYPQLIESMDGDWTAGAPNSFMTGRIYYSIADGNWNAGSSWSNQSHTGIGSSYYPGQLFNSDTVNIDGHTISYNISSAEIDSLRIGGTNAIANAGVLSFQSSPQYKSLSVRSLLMGADNGVLTGTTGGNRKDTINIEENLINKTTGSLTLLTDATNYTMLNFIGGKSSEISDIGVWGALAPIIINKTAGLDDSLTVSATGIAASTASSDNFEFRPLSGVLKFNNGLVNYISGNNGGVVDFRPNTGLHILNGTTVSTKTSVNANTNTTFLIDENSNFNVGNGANEHFLYQTGSSLSLLNGGMNVAGTFSKISNNSSINFNLANSSYLFVNTIANTDNGRIGFDLSSIGSTFNMNGGRIVVATANPSATHDFRVNASTGTVSGGTIQIGDTTITSNGSEFRIGSSKSLWNLHVANSAGNAVSTLISDNILTLQGNLEIDANHTLSLNSNTIALAGNLTNYGTFVGSPNISTASAWTLVLNGSTDQTILNTLAPGLSVHNLRVDKSAGNVLLSASGNSNLILKSSLEFTSSNNAYINAATNNKYVSIDPATDVLGQIIRVNLGHIYGTLKHWVNAGSDQINFTVGADTIESYRPLVFSVTDQLNTPGLLSVTSYNINHPEFPDTLANSNSNLYRYWNISSEGFSLATGATYTLKTYWLIPADTIDRNNPKPEQFEHFLRSPAFPAIGTWKSLTASSRNSTNLTSTGVTDFGDIVVGEPIGVTFYSRNNGPWDSPATWSETSYYVDDVPSRYPNLATDYVKIGNGKAIDIPENIRVNVRSLIVERDSLNQEPGRLNIYGDLNYVRGLTFILDDECTLFVQNVNGIDDIENSGAIQSTSRQFGKSNYIFNSTNGAQNTGDGIPDSVLSVTIDNSSLGTKSVFLNNEIGSSLYVFDSLYVRQGTLDFSNRNLKLIGNLVLDSIVNNGILNPAPSSTDFIGLGTKSIILDNQTGVSLNDVNLFANVIAKRRKINSNLQHVSISGVLDFNAPSTFALDTNINLTILNSDPNAIVNYDSDKYIRTSDTSGLLIREVVADEEYIYPIGSFDKAQAVSSYAPATFTASISGNSGKLGVRTSWGSNSVYDGAHIAISSDPLSRFIRRYWAIDSIKTDIAGKWKFQYADADVSGPEDSLTRGANWKPAYEGAPGKRYYYPMTITTNANTFETTNALTTTEYAGDWTIGNFYAFRRIFFSRTSGNWGDENTWTFQDNHTGPIFGEGDIPDYALDSVTIGNSHSITLDNDYTIGGTKLGTGLTNTGTLDLQSYVLSGLHFSISDNSTLKTGHTDGLVSLTDPSPNRGAVRTTITRKFTDVGVLANFVYNGTTNQQLGSGFPALVRNFTVNNLGTAPTNVTTIGRSFDIVEDLNVVSGVLDLGEFSLSKSVKSGDLNLLSGATIRIGGVKNVLTSLNNYDSYIFDNNSYIEFSGDQQNISLLPIGLTTLPYVNIINTGTKIVAGPLTILGDLNVYSPAILQNDVGNNSLQVKGSIINRSVINNEGIIEIGEE